MIPLLVLHVAITWALLGLIWTIQVLHYPLFEKVGRDEFTAYHEQHMARITWVVGPLMLAEVASAGWLFFCGERSVLFLVSLAALVLVWASTAVSQIPLHRKLAQGFCPATLDHLVRANWWRTIAWTVRGLCLAALLIQKVR
jgi:hypothetical protein